MSTAQMLLIHAALSILCYNMIFWKLYFTEGFIKVKGAKEVAYISLIFSITPILNIVLILIILFRIVQYHISNPKA